MSVCALACSHSSSCTCLPLRVYMATSLSPSHSFSLLLPDSFSTTAITRIDPFRVHFHCSRFYCRPFIYSLFPVASPAKIILGLIEHLPQSAFSGNEYNPTAWRTEVGRLNARQVWVMAGGRMARGGIWDASVLAIHWSGWKCFSSDTWVPKWPLSENVLFLSSPRENSICSLEFSITDKSQNIVWLKPLLTKELIRLLYWGDCLGNDTGRSSEKHAMFCLGAESLF